MKNLSHLFNVKDNTPGKIIRAFRTNFNITQKELCEIVGIHENNLSAIENNRRDIGAHTAKKIAAFFGIDPSSILFPNGAKDATREYQEIRRKADQLLKKKRKNPSKK